MPAPSLLELQRSARSALLDGAAAPGAAAALAAIDEGPGPAAEALAVHRNNVFASLTGVLAAAFPVVRRLVDERFFAYAAHEFIRGRPPARPCLAEFGAEFADFLAGFAPCRDLSYLPDVARLEWWLHEAAQAPALAPVGAAALAGVPPEETPRLTFRLLASLRYLASPWPVDRMWRANRAAEEEADTRVDVAAGGAWLEIRRAAGGVEMRHLPSDVFAFRQALSDGATLAAAAEAGLACDPGFDLAAALAGLFRDGLVTRVCVEMPLR